MFSLVSRLPSMSSASGFPPLFGHFVGTSRLSDSPTTCMLDFWLMAFSSRPTHNFVAGVDGVSRFSRVEFPCMPGGDRLFLIGASPLAVLYPEKLHFCWASFLGQVNPASRRPLALRHHFTSIRLWEGLPPPSCRTCSAHKERAGRSTGPLVFSWLDRFRR